MGNISRLNHVLDKIADEAGAYEARLDTLRQQMEGAKAELETPWPQEGVWMLKSERLAALNAVLNIDLAAPDEREEPDRQTGQTADGMEL